MPVHPHFNQNPDPEPPQTDVAAWRQWRIRQLKKKVYGDSADSRAPVLQPTSPHAPRRTSEDDLEASVRALVSSISSGPAREWQHPSDDHYEVEDDNSELIGNLRKKLRDHHTALGSLAAGEKYYCKRGLFTRESIESAFHRIQGEIRLIESELRSLGA
jgi:hypothetical protein